MLRLAAVLYVLVATVLGGSAVIAVMALGFMKGWQIAGAFGVGLVISLPIALVLGKKMYSALNTPSVGATGRHA